VAVVKTLAEEATVPVTLASITGKIRAHSSGFRAGFSGLMIDASAFALEENIRQTRAVVELAASVAGLWKGNWAIWPMRRAMTTPAMRI
jgi:fructose-bisphosphate aldolase class II